MSCSMKMPGNVRAFACAGLMLALGLSAFGCAEQLKTVPTELLGTWKTDSAAHANRFLRLRSSAFVLGVAGLELDVAPITRIERTRNADANTVYHLHFHADEGYQDVLVLTMVGEASDATLRIGAQPQVWRPAATR